MKKVSIIFSIGVMGILLSCSNKTNQISLDFGSAMYKEPFRGLLSSKPSWLVATLDYPPCSWLKPDTAIVAKSILVEFNEDAVRSNSIASIYFADKNGSPFPYAQWYCNGQYIPDGKMILHAAMEPQQLNLQAKIHPSAANTKFEGHIYVLSDDLDEANKMQLQEEGSSSIGDVCFCHEYGWPIILWLVWLIMALIIMAIVIGIIYLIYQLIKAIGIGLTRLIELIHLDLLHNRSSKPHSTLEHKNGKKGKNKSDTPKSSSHCPCCKFIAPFCAVLNNESSSIAQKCQSLIMLTDKWETLSADEKQNIYDQLCPKIKELLEAFWNIRKPTPTSNGRWEGLKGNGVFYFDSQFVPAEKNTRNHMNWQQLVAAYKKDFNLHMDGGIHYHHDRIDLKNYAIAMIKVRYEDSDLSKLHQRGGSEDTIQVIGAPLFEKKLKDVIRQGGYKDFWEYKDGLHNGEFIRDTPLVIHEDYDGETLMLVPKYLHDNWKHYGGIALCETIVKCLY